MYSISGWLEYVRVRPRPVASSRSAAIPRNVIFLGLTSLLTDISSEMVVSILPIYLVGFLGLSLVQFGIVDGLYQGVAGVTQLGSALLTDRWRRYREMAAAGYIASTLCRAGLLFTTTWTGITALLTLDRLGKGVRTAPRDALISLSVPRERLGFAFGVHRAMDAVGAMLGPVVAFAILGSIQNGFDVVFVTSLCLSIVGVAVLGFFVENRRADRGRGSRRGKGHGQPRRSHCSSSPASVIWRWRRCCSAGSRSATGSSTSRSRGRRTFLPAPSHCCTS